MGLLSIFQRNKQASATPTKGRGGKSAARQAPLANTQNPADAAEAMREVRARARTRLMGATVLLLIGVIGFPLLFETQPRPIPVDLPIEIPARNAPGVVDASSHAAPRGTASARSAGPLPTLTASGPAPESVSYDARPSVAAPASPVASASDVHRSALATLAAALTSSASHAGDAPASSPASASSTVAQTRPAAKPAGKPVAASTSTPPVAAAPRPTPHVAAATPAPVVPASKPSPAALLADSGPAKASDAAANGARFVVQVGAFLDEAKVRETRAKVEKLGMKTYTQPVDTPTGKRIRVRVGPYGTKAEADKSAARLKSDGLQAVVLAL